MPSHELQFNHAIIQAFNTARDLYPVIKQDRILEALREYPATRELPNSSYIELLSLIQSEEDSDTDALKLTARSLDLSLRDMRGACTAAVSAEDKWEEQIITRTRRAEGYSLNRTGPFIDGATMSLVKDVDGSDPFIPRLGLFIRSAETPDETPLVVSKASAELRVDDQADPTSKPVPRFYSTDLEVTKTDVRAIQQITLSLWAILVREDGLIAPIEDASRRAEQPYEDMMQPDFPPAASRSRAASTWVRKEYNGR